MQGSRLPAFHHAQARHIYVGNWSLRLAHVLSAEDSCAEGAAL